MFLRLPGRFCFTGIGLGLRWCRIRNTMDRRGERLNAAFRWLFHSKENLS